MHWSKTTERAPWITGKEPRVFTAREFDQLTGALIPPIKPRSLEAFRAVAVDKLSYCAVRDKLGCTHAYAQNAHLSGMKRLGLFGAHYYEPAHHERLVVNDVPRDLHNELTLLIRERVALYLGSPAGVSALVVPDVPTRLHAVLEERVRQTVKRDAELNTLPQEPPELPTEQPGSSV